MITQITTVEKLKEIFVETVLNKTDAVTKISDGSGLNAIAYGVAKNHQKILTNLAVLESYLFPDSGFGSSLDNYARMNGSGARLGARQSSTYIYVVGDPGTTYVPNTSVFVANNGSLFDIVSQYTIGEFGYGYVKVRSRTQGSSNNVDALTITQITNPPTGHQYCVNEYQAQYGSDVESDDEFRKRIKEGPNILSRGTISMIEQIFMKINENVLKVYYCGLDNNSNILLSILTENGIDLSDSDLSDILIRGQKFFSLTEMRPASFKGFGITLQNIAFQPIDVSLRAELDSNYDPDTVRKDMQNRFNKYLDYRYWRSGQKVDWANLLEIARNTEGVRYVNDAYFFPNADVSINDYNLPRMRGFQLLDLSGKQILDFEGALNPVYYPAVIDYAFQATVLNSI